MIYCDGVDVAAFVVQLNQENGTRSAHQNWNNNVQASNRSGINIICLSSEWNTFYSSIGEISNEIFLHFQKPNNNKIHLKQQQAHTRKRTHSMDLVE